MGNSRLRAILNWLPAAFAVAVIAVESTAMFSAANTSRWLLPIWIHLFGPISPERWDIIHHYIRKTGHFVGYGMVSLSFFYGWVKTLHRSGFALRVRSASYAIACTVVVASYDEIHQTFLPGRTGRAFDVGIDTCGAITMQLLILALIGFLTRKSAQSMPIAAPLAE